MHNAMQWGCALLGYWMLDKLDILRCFHIGWAQLCVFGMCGRGCVCVWRGWCWRVYYLSKSVYMSCYIVSPSCTCTEVLLTPTWIRNHSNYKQNISGHYDTLNNWPIRDLRSFKAQAWACADHDGKCILKSFVQYINWYFCSLSLSLSPRFLQLSVETLKPKFTHHRMSPIIQYKTQCHIWVNGYHSVPNIHTLCSILADTLYLWFKYDLGQKY